MSLVFLHNMVYIMLLTTIRTLDPRMFSFAVAPVRAFLSDLSEWRPLPLLAAPPKQKLLVSGLQQPLRALAAPKQCFITGVPCLGVSISFSHCAILNAPCPFSQKGQGEVADACPS
jgi:hypothetical protein